MSDLDFNVMLAKNYDPKRVECWKETYIDPKLNGIRVIVLAKNAKKPQYFTRNGRELGMFTHMDPSIGRLCERLASYDSEYSKGLMFDTEAMGVTFGDVSGAIHTKGTVALTCRLHVFHMMPYAYFKRQRDIKPQLDRITALESAVDGDSVKGITVAHPERVLKHSQVMRTYEKYRVIDPKTGKPKYEGAMVKNLQVPWYAGRSWHWMKLKEEITVDVTVTGMKEGKGKYVGMCGSLLCDYKGTQIRVGGMDDELRKKWFNKPKSIIGKTVEVEAQEETDAGSLRHPRFVRIRDDK